MFCPSQNLQQIGAFLATTILQKKYEERNSGRNETNLLNEACAMNRPDWHWPGNCNFTCTGSRGDEERQTQGGMG